MPGVGELYNKECMLEISALLPALKPIRKGFLLEEQEPLMWEFLDAEPKSETCSQGFNLKNQLPRI